jgi:hypothetical protein
MRTQFLIRFALLLLFSAGVLDMRAQFNFSTTQIGGGAAGTLTQDTQSPGSYIVVGGGNDIWSAADEFTFHYFPQSGSFDFRVRVESLEPNAPKTKAGLMLRESVNGNSRMAYVRVTPTGPTFNKSTGANDVRFQYRTGTTSAAQGEHEDPAAGFPAPGTGHHGIHNIGVGAPAGEGNGE